MAALIASSANIEQCNFTGGNRSSFAMSLFLILPASLTFIPLTHSVAREEEAIAEPQPKVLNAVSTISPLSFTLICNFITSPHAGAPTRPVPTFLSALSKLPTFLFAGDKKNAFAESPETITYHVSQPYVSNRRRCTFVPRERAKSWEWAANKDRSDNHVRTPYCWRPSNVSSKRELTWDFRSDLSLCRGTLLQAASDENEEMSDL